MPADPVRVRVRVVPFGGNTGAAERRGLDYEAARDLERRLDWPEGWPIPPVGAAVHLPREPGAGSLLFVRDVSFYPDGGDDGGDPFVYLVLGSRP